MGTGSGSNDRIASDNSRMGRNGMSRKRICGQAELVRTMELFGQIAQPDELMLLLVDINDFGAVNNTLGAEIGDRVLDTVGQAVMRAAGSGAIVGRLDGDRYGVLVFAPSEASVFGMACDILDLFESPMLVDGHRIDISARVGISHYLAYAEHPVGATLRSATSALSAAKTRDRYEAIVFSPRGRDGL